jgi:hypothetical protein
MDIFEKIADIAGWQIVGDGASTFTSQMQGIASPTRLIPDVIIVDIVRANGLKNYILSNDFKSQEDIIEFIYDVFKRTLNSPAFSEKKTRETFPLLANFYYYCQRIDRNGGKQSEAAKIAEQCWYGEMASKKLKLKTAEMFSVTPDENLYNLAVKKIKEIYGYTDSEIDALRYFVCQSKDAGRTINPSQNKQLYLWSKAKETGKTSVARAIVSILNGEGVADITSKFESNLSRELQYNAHDFPLAAIYNAVILDEAMPNDSSKVYGQLKKMLTSSGCDFNPKYNTIIHMECNRNYIFTSNNCISDYIKDDSDRRFIIVEPKRKPKQITFDAIYEIWKLFCQHAIPRMKWSEWYRQFEFIDGQQTKNIEEIKENILSNQYIIGELEQNTNYAISIGYFCKLLTNTQTPSTEIRKNIKLACIELFGNAIQEGGSTWKKVNIIAKLNAEKMNPLNDETNETDYKLPF